MALARLFSVFAESGESGLRPLKRWDFLIRHKASKGMYILLPANLLQVEYMVELMCLTAGVLQMAAIHRKDN